MKLRFLNSIIRKSYESFIAKEEVSNSVLASDSENNDFKVNGVKSAFWNYDKSIDINIFDFFSVVANDVSFIHIQIHEKEVDKVNTNKVRFSLSIDDNIIGDFNQFSMLNIKNLLAEKISIYLPTPEVEENNDCVCGDGTPKYVLGILIGYK